jgi:hypothetical protein
VSGKKPLPLLLGLLQQGSMFLFFPCQLALDNGTLFLVRFPLKQLLEMLDIRLGDLVSHHCDFGNFGCRQPTQQRPNSGPR